MVLLAPGSDNKSVNRHTVTGTGGAGKGNRNANGSFSSNPNFDRRISTLPGPAGAPALQRGLVANRGTLNGLKYGLKFLYNPSVLNVSHTLDMNATPLPPGYKSPNDSSTYIGPVNSSMSFDLLFDRTYELWDSSYAGSEAAANGVYSDVAAVYRMLGLIDYENQGGLLQSQMLPIQQIFQFGNFSANPKYPGSLKFLGYVTELDISYTHWTMYMIPARCTMSFSVQLIPNVPTYADETSSSSSVTSATKSPSSVANNPNFTSGATT